MFACSLVKENAVTMFQIIQCFLLFSFGSALCNDTHKSDTYLDIGDIDTCTPHSALYAGAHRHHSLMHVLWEEAMGGRPPRALAWQCSLRRARPRALGHPADAGGQGECPRYPPPGAGKSYPLAQTRIAQNVFRDLGQAAKVRVACKFRERFQNRRRAVRPYQFKPNAESNSELMDSNGSALPTQLRVPHIPFRCSEAVKEAEAADDL